MKAKLEFNLPEDQSLFDAACKATDLRSAVSDFDNELRNWIKHGHDFKNADDALEKVRESLYVYLNSYGINIHE
jgi:hypothetical protein